MENLSLIVFPYLINTFYPLNQLNNIFQSYLSSALELFLQVLRIISDTRNNNIFFDPQISLTPYSSKGISISSCLRRISDPGIINPLSPPWVPPISGFRDLPAKSKFLAAAKKCNRHFFSINIPVVSRSQ